jgi:hypothetical protein
MTKVLSKQEKIAAKAEKKKLKKIAKASAIAAKEFESADVKLNTDVIAETISREDVEQATAIMAEFGKSIRATPIKILSRPLLEKVSSVGTIEDYVTVLTEELTRVKAIASVIALSGVYNEFVLTE